MSDEIRKGVGGPGDEPGKGELPDREEVMPKDHELYTPQGGGGGTGSGPIREVAAVRDESSQAPPKGEGEGEGPEPVVLAQIGPEPAVAEALGVGADAGSTGSVGSVGIAPERPKASSLRLLMTLGFAGALAGALLVFVFLWSQPKILAYRAKVLEEAVTEVLKGPDSFESIFLMDGEFVAQVPEGMDTLDLDRVFLGYDGEGDPVGFAMEAEGFGFQDIIAVIFGYDAETGQVLGMKVLRHLETPGLGDKIVKGDQDHQRADRGTRGPSGGL